MEDRTLIVRSVAARGEADIEALSRRLLARQVHVRRGCAEAECIRAAETGIADLTPAPSVLSSELGLEEFAIGAVMPEGRVLALIVVDRSWPAVQSSELDAVQMFAELLAAALERIVLRQRIGEFAAELRYLTTSAQALVREVIEAPVLVPEDHGAGPVFAQAFPPRESEEPVAELFTPREMDVAEQLVAGRSNRDIAGQLQISPDTVKAYVARVMRKLEAANRADAAVRYLRLTSRAAGEASGASSW